MKISDYMKNHLGKDDADLILMDLLVANNERGDKKFTVGYTEDGRKFTFTKPNFDEAVAADFIKVDGETAVVDTGKLVNFSSGLSYVQLEETKPWSVESLVIPGK